MLNTKKIEEAMLLEKITKAEMFKRTGIGRTTFDAILAGSDMRLSTLEKIAQVLHRPIGYFFDEDSREVRVGDNSPGAGANNQYQNMDPVVISKFLDEIAAQRNIVATATELASKTATQVTSLIALLERKSQ